MRDRCSECNKPIAEKYAKYRTVDKNKVFCNGFCKYAWDTRKAVRKRLEWRKCEDLIKEVGITNEDTGNTTGCIRMTEKIFLETVDQKV